MNTIPKFQKEDSNVELTSLEGIEESIKPLYHETNITDGSYWNYGDIFFIGNIFDYWVDDGESPNCNCTNARKRHETTFEYERPYSNISKCNNK